MVSILEYSLCTRDPIGHHKVGLCVFCGMKFSTSLEKCEQCCCSSLVTHHRDSVLTVQSMWHNDRRVIGTNAAHRSATCSWVVFVSLSILLTDLSPVDEI
eukprot:m.102276 g.102276  ORF g.102276 m.102276 type:complete len:100 (+) comp12537_c0_seq2:4359-4658(+)